MDSVVLEDVEYEVTPWKRRRLWNFKLYTEKSVI